MKGFAANPMVRYVPLCRITRCSSCWSRILLSVAIAQLEECLLRDVRLRKLIAHLRRTAYLPFIVIVN